MTIPLLLLLTPFTSRFSALNLYLHIKGKQLRLEQILTLIASFMSVAVLAAVSGLTNTNIVL